MWVSLPKPIGCGIRDDARHQKESSPEPRPSQRIVMTRSYYSRRARHLVLAAVALTYFAYNFINIHRTLRVTPAMAAWVTDRLWEVSDLIALLESDEAEKAA